MAKKNEKDFVLAVWRCRFVAGYVRAHELGSLSASIMSRTESVVQNLLKMDASLASAGLLRETRYLTDEKSIEVKAE